MPDSVALSRKFLSDSGGWKEMKEARSLHAAGKIDEASYENGLLEGLVKDKGKTFRTRLEIHSRTDMENHCPCYRARREGIICAHALALGLEILEPTEKWKPEAATASAGEQKVKLCADWPEVRDEADDDTKSATLHLVLPPNLTDAWAKGRVTLGVEISIEGERCLLAATPKSTSLFFDAADSALYCVLQRISPETVPGMLSVTTDDLSRILSTIPGHEGVSLGRGDSLRLSYLPFRPRLARKAGLHFRVNWPDEVEPLMSGEGTWARTELDLLQPVAPGLSGDLQAVLVSGVQLDSALFSAAFDEFQRYFELDDLEISRPCADVHLKLEGSLNHLDAHLSFVYGDNSFAAATDRASVRETENGLVLADARTEAEAIESLEEIGFQRRGSEGRWVLKDKNAILQFLAHGYPRFQSRFQISTGERFDHALGQVEPIETQMEFRSSGEDWFAMELGFGTGSGAAISRQEIDRLLRMGQGSKPIDGGKIAVLNTTLAESFDEILSDCDPEQMAPGTYRIDQSQAGYLEETAKDFSFQTQGEVPWQTTEDPIEFYELSDDLAATLRPYQEEGVKWMQGLASQGIGGVLADDMGLGKTLQTLSFLYSVGGTSLVVCPSSLVFNWVAETEKFTPELRAVAIEGPNREKILAENADADIFVTSYALLRRDEQVWAERDFDVVVLDEAQHIKNPDAHVSKAAHRLKGTYRFALTGTPVENSVRDLWSIMQFALPRYLGRRQDFAERFEKPLSSSEPSASVRDRLSRRLRPVVLRRLKSEVAKDLPDKIEQVVYCDLKPKQRDFYEALLSESRSAILDADGGRQRMLALTALLRLRQTCCDLRLLGIEGVKDDEASVKAEIVGELLDEAIEGGHRVLVFSQFVEMLQILVPDLAAKEVDFCYLDGSTRNRSEVVKRFQEKDVPVFLISLKAGGVGLNLTAADTVIHVDPWWNPAVEAQATDRAHRIGQANVVTSYKLITRGTVEEKILALQNRKREMTEALLSEAGDAGLTKGEMLKLLE